MKKNRRIDFHTHAFSEKIAERAIAHLVEVSGFTPCTNGTLNGLLQCLDETQTDHAVVLSIATKPQQEELINRWVIDNSKRYADRLSFLGSVHPDSPTALQTLEELSSEGIRGIKLHPDYQGFIINDRKLWSIYEKCSELGLFIVFHAGYDPLSPELVHALPEQSAEVAEAFPKLKIVLAHLGGMYHWDGVSEYLAGRFDNVYFDTAFLDGHIDPDELLAIIRKHGAERILLGSDLPWESPDRSAALIESLNLSDDEKSLILYKNAEKLLGIANE